MFMSSPPLATGDIFQDPQWAPETEDSTEPSVYIHTCDKV